MTGDDEPTTASDERAPRRYHHGDLRRALLDLAIERARADGPEAIVLRELARGVGVTPRAAYRHFADRQALVAAVAQIGLTGMSDEIAARRRQAADDAAAAGLDPIATARAQLEAVGDGYIAYALAEPGLFDTALTGSVDVSVAASAPEVGAANPYDHLREAVAALVAAGALDPERATAAATLCWSSVHGFARLATKGPLRQLGPAAAGLGRDVVRLVVAGLPTGPAED